MKIAIETLTFKPFGEKALLIEWPASIDPKILSEALTAKNHLEKVLKIPIQCVYHSLLIQFPYVPHFSKEIQQIRKLLQHPLLPKNTSTLWTLPVAYDSTYGTDIEKLAAFKKISVAELIRLHTQPEYIVYGIGFLPGFLYLGGLDPKLVTPRRNQPRSEVPAGSVGIGGSQTGIYPQASPGGWLLIGYCPVPLFHPLNQPPQRISTGDRVRFESISPGALKLLEVEIKTGVYEPKKTVCHVADT